MTQNLPLVDEIMVLLQCMHNSAGFTAAHAHCPKVHRPDGNGDPSDQWEKVSGVNASPSSSAVSLATF